MTFAKALKRAGVVRVKPQGVLPAPSSPSRRASDGYTEAHRQQRAKQYDPSCLTDAGQEALADAARKYPGVKTLFADSAYAGQWA